MGRAATPLAAAALDGSVFDWRKALPIGNGDFGAAIHGYPDNYTFHIAKNDVWWDNLSGPDPYPSMSFAELRKRVAAGDASVKHDIRQTAETGVKPEPVPTSCARLTLQLCRSGKCLDPRPQHLPGRVLTPRSPIIPSD